MKFEYSPNIALNVKDRDKAGEFYKNVLGMNFVEDKNGDLQFTAGSMNFISRRVHPVRPF